MEVAREMAAAQTGLTPRRFDLGGQIRDDGGVKLCIGVLCWLVLAGVVAGQDPRITPAVELIAKIQPAIVPIFSRSGDAGVVSGTGVVVHERGYILTADHVTRDREGVAIFGLTRVAYQIVGRLPERDLALLKVELPKPIAAIPLGRSHDLRAGEPIVVGGNPGGRGVVFSQGTINAPSIDPTWPSLLAKTYFRDDLMEDKLATAKAQSTGGRPEYIQFDAMSNKGNSGGPLLNLRGELIGIVVQKSLAEESINWAIPIDRIRLWFPYFIQPEERGGFWAGLGVDLLAREARVGDVAAASPAAKAGIASGDVVQSVGGKPVRSGLDWLLGLDGRKSGDALELTLRRGGLAHDKTLQLAEYPAGEEIKPGNRQPGLNVSIYRGISRLQEDFKMRKPDGRGHSPSVAVDDIKKREKENFAAVFTGYLEFPQSGLHRLWLGADDGARLFLNGRLVIDNGLSHPYQELSRSVRVPKGLVPVRIEYFESRGDARLTLKISPEGSPGDRPSEFKLWRDAE